MSCIHKLICFCLGHNWLIVKVEHIGYNHGVMIFKIIDVCNRCKINRSKIWYAHNWGSLRVELLNKYWGKKES